MKIVCPSCAASYDVPDAVGVSKRTVRCARCGSDWVPGADGVAPHAIAPEAAPVPPPAQPVESAAPDFVGAAASDMPAILEPAADAPASEPGTEAEAAPEPAGRGPVRRQSSASAIAPGVATTGSADGARRQPMGAWAVSLGILVALGGAAIAFRAPIMHAWPPSARLYASVGLYHPDTAR